MERELKRLELVGDQALNCCINVHNILCEDPRSEEKELNELKASLNKKSILSKKVINMEL